MEVDDAKLISGWKDLVLSKPGSQEHDKSFWAFETLDRLCDEEPLHCWNIITKICEGTDNEEVLANTAAGPLEDLLVRHGKSVIGKVEHWAAQDRKNRRVLASVWKNAIDDAIWIAVKKATRGEVGL